MASDWQSMESAPKDGTQILIFEPRASDHSRDWYDVVQWGPTLREKMAWIDSEGMESCDGTHWMPLPNPPENPDG